jgi:hypothetical protein
LLLCRPVAEGGQGTNVGHVRPSVGQHARHVGGRLDPARRLGLRAEPAPHPQWRRLALQPQRVDPAQGGIHQLAFALIQARQLWPERAAFEGIQRSRHADEAVFQAVIAAGDVLLQTQRNRRLGVGHWLQESAHRVGDPVGGYCRFGHIRLRRGRTWCLDWRGVQPSWEAAELVLEPFGELWQPGTAACRAQPDIFGQLKMLAPVVGQVVVADGVVLELKGNTLLPGLQLLRRAFADIIDQLQQRLESGFVNAFDGERAVGQGPQPVNPARPGFQQFAHGVAAQRGLQSLTDRQQHVRQLEVGPIALGIEQQDRRLLPAGSHAQQDRRLPLLLDQGDRQPGQPHIVRLLQQLGQLLEGVLAQHPELGPVRRAARRDAERQRPAPSR